MNTRTFIKNCTHKNPSAQFSDMQKPMQDCKDKHKDINIYIYIYMFI